MAARGDGLGPRTIGTTVPLRGRSYALLLVAAAALWLVTLPWSPPPTYDMQWQLVWGEQLSRGDLPDYGSGPTVHPLIVLLGSGLSLLSLGNDALVDEAIRALTALAFVSIAFMCALVGHRVAGTAAALLVAVLVLTRPFIFEFAFVSYFDVIFVALCLAGFLVARAEHLGMAMILFAAAGLVRPEAWLFSLGLAGLAWYRGSRRVIPLALAVAAPMLWACFDLAVAGDPTYSFTNTSSAAAGLGRDRGPLDALMLAPIRAGQLVGVEATVLIVVGAALAWFLRRTSVDARWLLTISAVGFGSYLVVNGFGTSILSRYLLFPTMAAMPLIAFVVAQLAWNAADAPLLRRGLTLVVTTVCMITVTLGIKEISTLLPDAKREAREDESVRASAALLAGCDSIKTNDFFVSAVVARELDLSPAVVTLTATGTAARPPVTELTGTGQRPDHTAGRTLVRDGCSR